MKDAHHWYRVINSHNNNKHILNTSASRLNFGRELTESFWQFLMSTGTGTGKLYDSGSWLDKNTKSTLAVVYIS